MSAAATLEKGAKTDPQAPKRLMRFRVLEGRHVEGVSPNLKQWGPNCPLGDIVESSSDLVQIFNTRKGRKYERLDDAAAPAQPARDDFDALSVKQLLEFIAEENEGVAESLQLKVDPKATKAEILAKLRAHVPNRAG